MLVKDGIRYLTPKEICNEYKGMQLRNIYNAVKLGKLHPIPEDELSQFIAPVELNDLKSKMYISEEEFLLRAKNFLNA